MSRLMPGARAARSIARMKSRSWAEVSLNRREMLSAVSPSPTRCRTPETGRTVSSCPTWSARLLTSGLAVMSVSTETPNLVEMEVSVSPLSTLYIVAADLELPAPKETPENKAAGMESASFGDDGKETRPSPSNSGTFLRNPSASFANRSSGSVASAGPPQTPSEPREPWLPDQEPSKISAARKKRAIPNGFFLLYSWAAGVLMQISYQITVSNSIQGGRRPKK